MNNYSYIPNPQLFQTGFLYTPEGFREKQGLANQNISSACTTRQNAQTSTVQSVRPCDPYHLYPVNLPKVEYDKAGDVPAGCPCLSNMKSV